MSKTMPNKKVDYSLPENIDMDDMCYCSANCKYQCGRKQMPVGIYTVSDFSNNCVKYRKNSNSKSLKDILPKEEYEKEFNRINKSSIGSLKHEGYEDDGTLEKLAKDVDSGRTSYERVLKEIKNKHNISLKEILSKDEYDKFNKKNTESIIGSLKHEGYKDDGFLRKLLNDLGDEKITKEEYDRKLKEHLGING